MDGITIWTGRPPGSGVVSHFWFRVDNGDSADTFHRICDGRIWRERQEVDGELNLSIPCRECGEVYLADAVNGPKLLIISSSDIPVQIPLNPVDFPLLPTENGLSDVETEESQLPVERISVHTFMKFYQAPPHKREAVVTANGRGYDFYRPLIALMRRTHWNTNDITTFEMALTPFLAQQSKPIRADYFRLMAKPYVEYWKNHAAEYLQIDRNLSFVTAGLGIKVKPEIALRNKDGDYQILKLWLKKSPLPILKG